MSTVRTDNVQTTDSALNIPVTDVAQLTNLANDVDPTKGAALIGWNGTTVDKALQPTIHQYGTITGINDSAAAAAMIADINKLIVPTGVTVALKNIELFDDTEVLVEGTLKLPNGAFDFDRMFLATGRTNINIDVSEIDGNASNQGGSIGTHIIYFLSCEKPKVNIRYLHDHYYVFGGAFTPTDGIRDASTGAVFLYQCNKAKIEVGLLENWGREGIQLRQCTGSEVALGHAQGSHGGAEYSALQVAGTNNKILRASVDLAGASAVGFDTVDGEVSNILATRVRANHGLNLGHPGFPATRAQVSNVVVDGAELAGIAIASSSQDVNLSNINVRNCGTYGISASDGVLRTKVSNAICENSGIANVNALGAEVSVLNIRKSVFDTRVITVGSVVGTFVDGESITSSGGATATVRKTLKALSTTILFLSGVTGTFTVSHTITGGTSGATGTITIVRTPVEQVTSLGGTIIGTTTRDDTGPGVFTKFDDGTMIYRHTVSLAVGASTLGSTTVSYPVSSAWFSVRPQISASLFLAGTTNAFDTEQLRISSSLVDFTLSFKATVAQTYTFDVMAVGRWK